MTGFLRLPLRPRRPTEGLALHPRDLTEEQPSEIWMGLRIVFRQGARTRIHPPLMAQIYLPVSSWAGHLCRPPGACASQHLETQKLPPGQCACRQPISRRVLTRLLGCCEPGASAEVDQTTRSASRASSLPSQIEAPQLPYIRGSRDQGEYPARLPGISRGVCASPRIRLPLPIARTGRSVPHLAGSAAWHFRCLAVIRMDLNPHRPRPWPL